jgi:hypothetical protein
MANNFELFDNLDGGNTGNDFNFQGGDMNMGGGMDMGNAGMSGFGMDYNAPPTLAHEVNPEEEARAEQSRQKEQVRNQALHDMAVIFCSLKILGKRIRREKFETCRRAESRRTDDEGYGGAGWHAEQYCLH